MSYRPALAVPAPAQGWAGRASAALTSAARVGRSHVRGAVALGVVVAIVLIAVFADFIAPHDPYATNVRLRLNPPSREYLLGTDQIGRDVLSRVMYGARVSITVGIAA